MNIALPFRYSLSHIIKHLLIGGYVLAFLSIPARSRARVAGIGTNDYFVGIRYSGHMGKASAESGLRAVVAEGSGDETEILFHPGEVRAGEPLDWSGDRAWHYASARAREREFLMSPEAGTLFDSFRARALPAGLDLDKVLRYLIAGSFAAFTHLGSLFVLTDIFGLWYLTANVAAFGLGLIVSFGLQKLWTFKDAQVGRVHHQAFFYTLVQLASLGIDTVGLYVLVEYIHIWYLAAQFLMLILIAAGNFFIFNGVIFKDHGDS